MILSEFLNLFKQGKVSATSHMKNLLEMAMVDGEYDDTEDKLLIEIAKKHKISQKKLHEIKDTKDHIEFIVPKEDSEKFNQLFDLVHMMVIDDRIAAEELRLCVLFAKKFGYESEKANELVNSIASNIQNGQNLKETKKRVSWLM